MDYRVLGPVEILDGGRSLPLRSDKQRALLAILLTRAGHLASVDWLIEELWAGSPPDTAASALRVHVTGLRRVLEPGRPTAAPSVRLPLAHPGYRLTMEPDELDAQRFERAAVLGRQALLAGRVDEAVKTLGDGLLLWRGPAFVGIDDIACVSAEVQRLDEMRVSAFESLVEARLKLGEHQDVVQPLTDMIDSEPLREPLTGQLALALYRSGRQAEALRAIDALRARLLDELGLDVSPAVRELEHDILQQSSALDLRPERSIVTAGGPAASTTSFVGRKPELDALRLALEAAARGRSRAVFLGGAPGIGKTSLAAEFAAEVGASGATVCLGRCDAEPIGPYQPFREALRSLLGDRPLDPADPVTAEVARLVPELGAPVGPSDVDVDAETDRHRLFEAVAAVLRGVERPIVMVLDDLQWADTPSVLLARHLVRHEDAGRLLLVGLYRDTDVEPGDQLTTIIRRLSRDGIADHLTVSGLDEVDVESLVRTTTRAEVLTYALTLVPELQGYTGGNPFFIQQVLRRLAERGVDAGAPELRDLVPAAVRDLVGEQVGRLSEEAAVLLRTAAVVGQEFDLGLLAEATDAADERVLEAVEEALAARLVAESASTIDRFAFSHSLVRDVLYQGMPTSRRTRLHRDVGRALERVAGDHPEGRHMELAHHFLEAGPAGDPLVAAAYAAAGAAEAEAALAFENAVELCQRGLVALEGAASQAGDVRAVRCDLVLRQGRSELFAGREGGRETLLRAADLAGAIDDPDRMAMALLSLNRGFFARTGKTDQPFVDRLEEAISARSMGDDLVKAELLATLASELVWAAHGERRFSLSDEALDMARRLGGERALARVLLLRSLTIAVPDTLAQRSKEGEELLALAEQLNDPMIRFQAAFHGSGTAHEAGDLEAAHRLVKLAGDIAVELRQPSLLWLAEFMSTGSALSVGRLADAEACAQHALELGQAAHRSSEAHVFYGEQILEIRRWQDRLPELLDFFAALAGLDGVDYAYALLRYLFDAGEVADASRIYEEVMARVPLPPRRDLLALPTICNLSYLAHRLEDHVNAPALYDVLTPWADIVMKTTVPRSVGHHYLGLLAITMGAFDRAEEHLAAASAAHGAMGMVLASAETSIDQVELHLRGGGEHHSVKAQIGEVRAAAESLGARYLLRRSDEVLAGHPGG